MRYLVTGAGGMLGTDVQKALAGREVTALERHRLDITDLDAVVAAVAGYDAVINTAAYTAVDAAEEDEDVAYAVNAIGARNLARAAHASGAKLVQISTDYVFDGSATEPYAEDSARCPLSAYGRTKAAGEELAQLEHPDGTFIVRTAWLYGEHGQNFARTMLRIAEDRATWTVVDDQVGQPTWTADLAAQIVALLDSDAPAGVYHGTNDGRTTWYGFARAVLEESGMDPERITPTDSSQFVRAAPRPAFSVLGHDSWASVGLQPMRPWHEALHAAAKSGAFATR